MNYKFVIYDENELVVSYGETNTPIENMSSDLGNIIEVQDFGDILEVAPNDSD